VQGNAAHRNDFPDAVAALAGAKSNQPPGCPRPLET
jgi:hypothetical protein